MTEILTDEEISKAFEGTRFGENPNFRELLAHSVLKKVCGNYRSGYTMTTIMRELGLTSGSDSRASYDDKPTDKGREYCFGYFYDSNKSG